jgi:hypothetical protein
MPYLVPLNNGLIPKEVLDRDSGLRRLVRNVQIGNDPAAITRLMDALRKRECR